MKNLIKILYILGAGIGVFFINNIYILLGVIAVHFVALFLLPKSNLRFLYKVKWFILIIFVFHAFTGANDIEILQIRKWVLALSYAGMLKGAIMVSKLVAMLLITQSVRLSMKKKEFIQGMTSLGLSVSSAEIIDEIFEIVSETKGKNKGQGKNKKNKEQTKDEVKSKDVLFRGRVGKIPQKLMERINFAKEKFANNPNAVVASSALSVTLIRMVKIAPGLPLAPGHKNILLFPVFIYGATKSGKRFSGSQIGFISGILHFSMGFGKYGPLGILQFAVLGFVIDLILLLPFRKTNLIYLMFIGAMGGLVRISTELLLAFILGMPNAFYLIYLPYVISQVAFGAASGFITKSILKPKDE